MKVLNYFLILVIFLILGVSVNGQLMPDEITRKIDEHHLIGNDFEMTIKVESFINNQSNGLTIMKCNVNNGKMSTLTFLEPSNMKGRKIVVKGDDMWLIIPTVKNPIHITASQRLVGGISYSDIAGVSFAQNYTAKINGEESIIGLNADGNKTNNNFDCLILELTANDKQRNYHKIMAWVDKTDFLTVKAEFFALSGKKMMTVYYTDPKEWEGKKVITKMFLFDQINTNKYFSVEYSEIESTTGNL